MRDAYTAYVTIKMGRSVFTEIDFTYDSENESIENYVTTTTFGAQVGYPSIEGKINNKAEFEAAINKWFSKWPQPRFKMEALCFTKAELDAIED